MTPTDILIPLGQGSRHGDIELRYCLRSIEKHLQGVGNIWIVGEKPAWLRGVVHVPCRDASTGWMRAHNIYRKIVAGCNEVQDLQVARDADDFINNTFTVSAVALSHNFLFMNDDHYLLQDYVAGLFPFYHRGPVDINAFKGNIPQKMQYQNTTRVLGSAILDFGVHCPVLYNKQTFRDTFEGVHWPDFGYEIKTYYCNNNEQFIGLMAGSSVQRCSDLKFREAVAGEREILTILKDRATWFSIGDRSLKSGGMLNVLAQLYPHKSRYE